MSSSTTHQRWTLGPLVQGCRHPVCAMFVRGCANLVRTCAKLMRSCAKLMRKTVADSSAGRPIWTNFDGAQILLRGRSATHALHFGLLQCTGRVLKRRDVDVCLHAPPDSS